MSALGKYLIPVFKTIFKEAADEALSSEDLWKDIDQLLQEEIEKSKCCISFHCGEMDIVVSLGDDALVFDLKEDSITIETETFDVDGMSAEHATSLEEQLGGIDRFSARLAEARNALEENLKQYLSQTKLEKR